MAKTVDEWRKHVEEWKKVLNEPKNLGLKAGGTGLSEKIRQVGDAEAEIALALKGRNVSVSEAYAHLSAELTQLISLCKSTSDKHKKLFTTACAFLDTRIKPEAEKRKSELQGELAELRKEVAAKLAALLQRMTNAKEIHEFGEAWAAFASEFSSHGKSFPHLKPFIAKVEALKKPEGNLEQVRPPYMKLAQECKNASTAMA